MTYLGDSEIGENVNVGAGVITCNYDGVNKHKTIIKDNVFVGSDSQLIAPIIVEEGVTIAAGSTITDNSEKDSLLIARSRQQEKKIGKDKVNVWNCSSSITIKYYKYSHKWP